MTRHIDDAEAQVRRVPTTPDLGPLFDPLATPRARRDDPATSHAAAASATPSATAQAHAILRALLSYGPATADELDARMGWDVGTAGKRTAALKAGDYLTPTGATRPTRKGRQADVYRLTAKGRTASLLDATEWGLHADD